MKLLRAVLVVLALVIAAATLHASGPIGVYGIVEKVVFEPAEGAAERVQLFGAFAYVDERADMVSPARKGYLYFKLPDSSLFGAGAEQVVRREWADLKVVAGTGQAVGFGSWSYIGGFEGLRPETNSASPPYIIERAPRGGAMTDMRVRPAAETPTNPASYQTNAGIVKLAAPGSHAAIVKQLQEALKR